MKQGKVFTESVEVAPTFPIIRSKRILAFFGIGTGSKDSSYFFFKKKLGLKLRNDFVFKYP